MARTIEALVCYCVVQLPAKLIMYRDEVLALGKLTGKEPSIRLAVQPCQIRWDHIAGNVSEVVDSTAFIAVSCPHPSTPQVVHWKVNETCPERQRLLTIQTHGFILRDMGNE